jgi:hypothetical protein
MQKEFEDLGTRDTFKEVNTVTVRLNLPDRSRQTACDYRLPWLDDPCARPLAITACTRISACARLLAITDQVKVIEPRKERHIRTLSCSCYR